MPMHPTLPPLEAPSVQAASSLDSTWDRGAGTLGWWSSMNGDPRSLVWSALLEWHLAARGCSVHPQSSLAPRPAPARPCVAPSLQPRRGPLPPVPPGSAVLRFPPLRPAHVSTIPGFPALSPRWLHGTCIERAWFGAIVSNLRLSVRFLCPAPRLWEPRSAFMGFQTRA